MHDTEGTWPPTWGESSSPGGGGGKRRFPPRGWPTHGQLDYARELIVVVVLILALPYVVTKLLTRPGDVLGNAAKQIVVKRAVP